jgi:hypothetical protein
MGLINKIFGERGSDRRREGRFDDSADSESSPPGGTRSGQRRELVHVVFRDTMRHHGIPSDWMEASVLKVNHGARSGLHVQLIVRREHEQLLAYVPAFQESFIAALRRVDPRALEWMKSLSWQFDGMVAPASPTLPSLKATTAAPTVASPAGGDDSDLQQDLKALFAIRDQALQDASDDNDPSDFQPTQPMR